jgi:hypothetical protein
MQLQLPAGTEPGKITAKSMNFKSQNKQFQYYGANVCGKKKKML